jgi:hypothetical protein
MIAVGKMTDCHILVVALSALKKNAARATLDASALAGYSMSQSRVWIFRAQSSFLARPVFQANVLCSCFNSISPNGISVREGFLHTAIIEIDGAFVKI